MISGIYILWGNTMANFTKRAIQESFIKLLTDRPLSKITVKDIVADCGINRNTFYYYFSDIPKLIEDIVEEDAERIIQSYPTVEKFEDCIEALVETALSKKRAVLHIYHSVNRDIYELYLWKVCDHIIDLYISTVLNGRKADDGDIAVIKKLLCGFAFGTFSYWLKNEMEDDIRGTIARLSELKKDIIEDFLLRC